MFTKPYEDHTKEELLAEINARGIEGVTMATSKPDMVAALELNDEPASSTDVSKEESNSLIPKADPITPIPADPSEAPKDSEYTGGLFTKDNMDWALAVKSDAPNQRTHFAKNSTYFWNGTEEEFKAQFEKK